MKPQIHRIIKLTETQLILKLHTAALMYSIYEACLNGTIKIEDCSPTHSLNNMYEKISVINNLLDFKHSKCYRIGEKNLITKDNDFELATGNRQPLKDCLFLLSYLLFYIPTSDWPPGFHLLPLRHCIQ